MDGRHEGGLHVGKSADRLGPDAKAFEGDSKPLYHAWFACPSNFDVGHLSLAIQAMRLPPAFKPGRFWGRVRSPSFPGQEPPIRWGDPLCSSSRSLNLQPAT